MPGVRDGDFLHAYGSWSYSKKYGWGIKAEGCSLEIPSNLNGVRQFLCRFCRGIGESTAKKIVDKFGEDAIAVITEDYQRLTEIPRISEKKAKAWLVEQVGDKKAHALIEQFEKFCEAYDSEIEKNNSKYEKLIHEQFGLHQTLCDNPDLESDPWGLQID